MRSATTGFFSTFASTKSLMRHRRSQRLKNVAASLYGPGPCDTVKAVGQWVKPPRDGVRRVALVVGKAEDRRAAGDLGPATRFDLALREEELTASPRGP